MMKASDIRPLNGWVLLLPDQVSAPAGIIIPESVTNYGYSGGTVVSVSSPYYPKEGNHTSPVTSSISVGDRVVCRDYLKDLETVDLDCGDCCFIHISDILCTVPEGVPVE